MLRKVRIKNFINFKDEQKLDFDKGPNFFIGPNNSGKSSVSEAIRRCLSLSSNTSMSSSYDKGKESVVMCIYHGIQDTSNLQDESGVEEDKNYKKVQGQLLTSIIALPESTDVKRYVKIAIYFGCDGCYFGMDLIHEDAEKRLVNERIPFLVTKTTYDFVNDMLETPDVERFLDHFIRNDQFKEKCKTYEKTESEKSSSYSQLGTRRDNRTSKDEEASSCNEPQHTSLDDAIKDTPCNRLLHTQLDGIVVFIFPMRSIGPLQWSRSERMKQSYRAQNYEDARNRSEVIDWYASQINTPKESNREAHFFGRITNNSGFTFGKKGDELIAKLNSKELSILKVPEGILEAKICSILLAVDCFTTIGLEDPESGMHPQMIDRLRDLVLWEMTKENKVVFLTTHHPSLIASWTIPRIFFFRHETNTSNITAGKEIIEKENLNPNVTRIITGNHFSSLFFAQRILFVEGQFDDLFMSTVRTLFLECDCYFTEATDRESFRTFLASLQIIYLHGKGNALKFYELCKTLKIESYFLLDHDAIISKKDKNKTFAEMFELPFKQAEIENDVMLLEQLGFFVWKEKAIETAILDICNAHVETHKNESCELEHEDVERCLRKNKMPLIANKMPLQFKTKKTKIEKPPLKKLTDENIRALVKLILTISKKEIGSDVTRFLQFLCKQAQENT